MNARLNPFEPLDPPPGGLARLRERLDRAERARIPRLAWLAPAAACLAAAVLLVARPAPSAGEELLSAVRLSAHPSAVALGLAPASSAPVSVPSGQARRVAISEIAGDASAAVIIYRVESLSGAEGWVGDR